MARYIVRKYVRTYFEIEVEADSKEDALEEVENLQIYEWDNNPSEYDEEIVSVKKKEEE